MDRKTKDILRSLAMEQSEIAAKEIHKEKIKLWHDMNMLNRIKPMLYINEIPWHEMNVNDELTCVLSKDHILYGIELELRRTIYSWKHMPGDMVVKPYIEVPYIVENTGFGINEDVDTISMDEESSIVSRHFHKQISTFEDLEKIKYTKISINEEKSKLILDEAKKVFDGVIEVRQVGQRGFWFAPWDEFVRYYGVQEALIDLYDNEELIHASIEKITQVKISMLEQYEELGLLASNNTNARIGSGAYGYTSELKKPDIENERYEIKDLWGCATAQIFSEVSPSMHEEFALEHEKKWVNKFGIAYYGCCEPLHRKLDILKKHIPNLRKVSMSRWIDVDVACENFLDDLVFSYKPNPAIFASKTLDIDYARAELEEVFKKTKQKNIPIEFIMKDISTVSYVPQNLWKWQEMAMEIASKY